MQAKRFLATMLILSAIAGAFYAGSIGFGFKHNARPMLMPTGQYTLSLAGNTYYVDAENGNDSNPGTSDAPWKTIGRAYTWYSGTGPKVQEGDTVLFRNGNYGEFKESTADNPGEKWLFYRNNRITYKADEGHSPVFTKVYIRNEDKWPPIEHGRSYLVLDGFRVENGVHLLQTSYVQIKNCDVSMQITVPYEGYNAPYYVNNSATIDLTNVHYASIVNCNTYDSCNPIYATNSTNITISGNESYRMCEDGIKFGANVNNILIENNYIHTWRNRSGGIALIGNINGKFEVGERVTQAGTNAEGIVYSVNSDRIGVYEMSEAQFDDPKDGGGIITGPSGIINPFTDQDPAHTDGISFQGTDAKNIVIRGNRIIGATAQGIKIENDAPGSMDNVLFENNLIHSSGQSLSITAVTNMRMLNNTFTDDPSNDIQGARFSCGKGNTTITEMYNNLFDTFHQFGDSGSYTNKVISHGNNIFGRNPDGTGGPAYPFALNGTEKVMSNFNTLFTNASANDYTLAAGSIAIDFGNPDYAPATDILGNPRVGAPGAGAYEYQGTALPCAEGTTKQCGTTDTGECSYGAQTCIAGSWGNCTGAISPTAEQCTGGKDEDCDSLTDCTDTDCTASPACTTTCIDTPALLNHIAQWKTGNITMPTLMQKITAWKTREGCG